MLIALIALVLAAPPVVNLPQSTVVLPWNEFQVLYQKGLAPDKVPPAAPRDYTLDNATYVGRLQGQDEDAFGSFTATFRGRSNKTEGWTVIPLLSTATALRAAKMDGKDAPIFLQDGYYTLITNKTGPFVVEMEFAVNVATADGQSGFSFPVAASGATAVSFQVDAADALDFALAGARGVTVTNSGTSRRVDASIPSSSSLAISWRREISAAEEKAAEQPPRVYAETHTLVGVSEGVTQVDTTVNYTVLHAGVDHFRVQLPKDVTVIDVKGAGLRDWSASTDGIVDVSLNYEALGAWQLKLQYEQLVGQNTDIPLVRVLDVAREKSLIGVDARSAVELIAGTPTNAVAVDVRELPAAILGLTDHPVLLGFKARGGDVKIPLDVRTHPDVDMLVTLVDSAVIQTLVTEDGRRMTRLQYAVRNNRNQFLRLSLPDNAEVWSATVAGRGVKVAKADDGGILVPLVRSDASGGTLTGFLVELVYVEKGEELAAKQGTLKLELPQVAAPTSLLQWTVYAPTSLKVEEKSKTGSVRAVPWFSAAPQLPELDPETAQRAATQMAREAVAQQDAMGQGVEPVDVTLPLAGQMLYFEKMLVLDEELWMSFDYQHRKVKKGQ